MSSRAILAGRQLPFGKKFTYSADQHELCGADRAVFLFLKQILDAGAASGRDYRSSEDRKDVTVPASMVKELLKRWRSVRLSTSKQMLIKPEGKR